VKDTRSRHGRAGEIWLRETGSWVLERGEGVLLHDADGREYPDALSGGSSRFSAVPARGNRPGEVSAGAEAERHEHLLAGEGRGRRLVVAPHDQPGNTLICCSGLRFLVIDFCGGSPARSGDRLQPSAACAPRKPGLLCGVWLSWCREREAAVAAGVAQPGGRAAHREPGGTDAAGLRMRALPVVRPPCHLCMDRLAR